jgi:bacterioferritin-associated ferredoxin
MDWQLAVVGAAVLAAAAYVGRAALRTWVGSKVGCGSGCGKCATPAPEPAGRRVALPQL